MPTAPNGPPARLLLATDLSGRCDRALDRAALLAQAWNATLVVVHVLESRLDDFDYLHRHELPSWRRAPDRAALAESQIRRDLGNGPNAIVVRIAEGDPVQRIEEIAREEGCGLIVTGVARDQTLGRIFLGATVDRLIRRSRVPVLVVKSRAKRAYEKIVVATDFSDSSLYALEATLAHFPNAAITLLHAYEPPFEGLTTRTDLSDQLAAVEREASAEFLAKSGLSEADKARIKVLIERGSPDSILRAYVDDVGADLIVAGSHGRSAVFDVLIGSTAKRIVENAAIDVLLVREPRAAGAS